MTASAPSAVSPKAQFLGTFERECSTTLRVLRAYPKGKESVQPSTWRGSSWARWA